MAGKHRNPDQPGDRVKVLKAGALAMAQTARKSGASESKIQETLKALGLAK